MGEAEFSFESWFPFTTLALSLVGVVTNILSALKLRNDYDLKKAIYLTVFIDACRAATSFGILTLTSLTFLCFKHQAHVFLGCTFLHTSAFFAPLPKWCVSLYCQLYQVTVND